MNESSASAITKPALPDETRADHRDDANRLVTAFLREVGRRERLFGVLTLFLGCIAACAAWLLAALLLDQALRFDQSARVLLLRMSAWVLGCAGLLLLIRLLVRGRSALYLAKRVEDRFGLFRNGLIAYVELLGKEEKESLGPHESEALVCIGQDVGEKLLGVDIDQVIPLRHAKRVFLGLAACVGALGLYGALHRNTLEWRLGRVLLPARYALPPTRTRIWKVTPGNARVLRGEPVTIKATVRSMVRGETPQKVELHYRGESESEGAWYVTPLRAGPNGPNGPNGLYAHTLPGLPRSIVYFIRADDDESERFHLIALPRPMILRIEAAITPPDYSDRTPYVRAHGTFDVLAGSRVRLTGRTNVDVGAGPARQPTGRPRAELLLDGKPRRVELADSRTLVTERFTVRRTIQYAFVFQDTDGHENTGRLTHTIRCIADRPPEVSIAVPGAVLTLPANGRLPLTITARDDVGLAAVAIHVRAGQGRWQTRTLRVPRGDRSVVLRHALRLEPLDLKPGQTLTCYASCTDTRSPEPQTVESERFVVKIVDLDPVPGSSEDQVPWTARVRTLLRKSAQVGGLEASETMEELADLLSALHAESQSRATDDQQPPDREALARRLELLAQLTRELAEQSGPGAGGEQAPPTRDGERTGGRDEGKSEGASGAGNNAASDGGGSESDKASNTENDGAGQGKAKETANTEQAQPPVFDDLDAIGKELRDTAEALRDGEPIRPQLDRLKQLADILKRLTQETRSSVPGNVKFAIPVPADADWLDDLTGELARLPAGDIQDPRTDVPASDADAVKTTDPESAEAVMPTDIERVAPEYQKLLEAYFRALGAEK